MSTPARPPAPRATYTVREAAAVLGVSPRLIYELVARNELRALHLGRRVVIPRDVIADLLEAAS